MEIIVFNGFEGKHTFELTTAQSLEAKSTVRSIETKPFTVTHTTLSNTAVAIISFEETGQNQVSSSFPHKRGNQMIRWFLRLLFHNSE